ncbi:MAG: PilX N-terminal domain-containing pilus assembly protein [Sulfuricaulis sp.]|uniref:pilus assembly PilX family protein n=1 Tax=Sulfuricaulis sp. TaxID=2003553 RepID=UPI003C33991B
MKRRPCHLPKPSSAACHRQRGTALIMSLVILMILTILGITAMSTASLEEKMSGNTQEGTRAFEVAESGLNQALSTPGSLDLNSTPSTPPLVFPYTTMNASASVSTLFVQNSPPRRGSGYGNTVEAANFDQASTGTTGVGAKAVIHQGVAQIVPKSN